MEQSYKEKYEQAIERLKQWDREHPCAGYVLSDRDKFIFPELAESEDEKIRMEIINYFQCQSEEEPTRKEIHNKWIAWLENIPVIIDHEKREGFHLGYKACLERQGEQEKDILEDAILDGYILDDDEDGLIAETIRFKKEKQSEQEPADKVEPKFHEGEWVVNKLGDLWHIDSFDKKNYQVYDGKGNYNYFPISKQNEMRLWTIQDAKDGDVLAVEDKNFTTPFVAIFKERGLDFFNSYCFIGFDGIFYKGEEGHSTENIHPATTEQRDLLFQKMKEAGYEWNDGTKELKKIEPKTEEDKGNIGEISSNSEWCEENEPHKELAESYLAKFDKKFPILPTLKGKQLADYKNFLNKCQQIFRLKYWGIRPIQAKLFEKLSLLWAAWGAEHLQGLGQTDGDMDNEISMWSEEDEDYLFLLNSICKDAEEKYRNSPDVLVRKEIANARNWLKSLRPHNRWKPSDEQMWCLSDAIEHYNSLGYPAPKLKELLDDLKKLKGEV